MLKVNPSRKGHGFAKDILSQRVYDVGYPASGQWHPRPKALLVLFSPFLLKYDHLLAESDRFYDSFHFDWLDHGSSQQSISLCAHHENFIEDNLN